MYYASYTWAINSMLNAISAITTCSLPLGLMYDSKMVFLTLFWVQDMKRLTSLNH